jgi:hypothetical protein
MADSSSNDRIRSLLVLLATAATIAFNALAAMGYINGITPAEISDKYPTIITPAGYAFSIWSAIYLGLSVFSIYQLLPGNLGRYGGIRTLYIASCVLNCAWIYFWHHDRPGICAVLIVALAAVLIVIVAKFAVTVTAMEAIFVKGTFGLYAGWVTVASIVNVFVFVRSAGSEVSVSSTAGVAAVLLATAIAVLITWKYSNYLYSLAVAWALTAIAIKQSGQTLLVVACSIGVIVSLLMAVSFVLKLPSAMADYRANE